MKTLLNCWKIRSMKDAFQRKYDDLDAKRRKEAPVKRKPFS